MAALHSALQALGPCKFEDVPTSPPELEPYLQDLFQQAQLILESIPIPPPDEKLETRPRSHTTTSIASNASEISSSSARSAPPIAEYAALQKEWGKPIKLSAKDNPLNMAVYRMGGKDGRGAWFARRSVQEGLGFAKFKKSLEMEFPESLAVQGAPGEGNVRGIGGDKRVEDISVPGKGRVEVFQLSAQFPGPTTPRDFVTLLITSSNAIKQNDISGRPDLTPRHYMIISKPCDHPETQPRDGFVRGNYESVEFIREVPRRPTKTMSSLDLTKLGGGKRSALEKEALLRNAEKKMTNTLSTNHENRSMNDLSAATKGSEELNRRRGKTISFSESKADDLRADDDGVEEKYDSEANPVEWIMVTRSDPGGSVPRFMVERGTPGSIVADASKFLNWACQNEDIEDSKGDSHVELVHRRDSIASYQTNGHLAGLDHESAGKVARSDELSSTLPSTSHSQAKSANQAGILSDMTGALSAGLETYAPQIVLDHLPGHTPQGSVHIGAGSSITLGLDADDDSSDSISTISFASADSHLDNESSTDEPHASLSPTTSKSSSQQKDKLKDASSSKSKHHLTPHEKELAKLSARRTALDAKIASTRTKSAQSALSQTQKEKEALRRAEEKHSKEMAKQEEKYRREIEKIEQRKKREEKKMEDRWRKEQEKAEGRRKKEEEKDQRTKAERERDEAREEVKRLRAEIGEVWIKRVERLEAEIQKLKGSGEKDGDLHQEDEGGKEKETDDKPPALPPRPVPVSPVVEKDFVKKNLLKEERSGLGSRMRGVSFGSGSPKINGNTSAGASSDGESGKSTTSSLRGSSLLKRATTTMGMMGGSVEGHKKGASS